jgi:cytochrome c oxidase cbb3-type subunit 3
MTALPGSGRRVAPFTTARAILWLALGAWVLLGGCHSEERRLREKPAANALTSGVELASAPPGPIAPPPWHGPEPIQTPELGPAYMNNPWAISEGKRLFGWYNCSGCHARGGGGMGPPLMDDRWLYGDQPGQIFATIASGRPNGMPSWGTRLPEQHIWQLVAYVRSLSGRVTRSALSPRGDELSYRTEQRQPVSPPPEPAR